MSKKKYKKNEESRFKEFDNSLLAALIISAVLAALLLVELIDFNHSMVLFLFGIAMLCYLKFFYNQVRDSDVVPE